MPLSHAKLWKALDNLARREGLSASGLARRAGLDPTSFNPSKRFGPPTSPEHPARPRWPSTESLTRILEATGISLGDFADLAEDPTGPAAIPLIGLAQAGADGFFDDAGLPTGDGWDQTELPRPAEGLFSLLISGESMTPLYRPGDRVIVDQGGSPPRKGDRVVVRTTSGETMAKELTALSARHATLGSINPAFAPRVLARSDIAWMARILWVSQ